MQCYGPRASDFTARKLTGRSIRLEFDVERLDRYGRTLAYVWLGGRLFNRTLVADGHAVVSTYPPNVRYVDVFEAAQRIAKRERLHRSLHYVTPVERHEERHTLIIAARKEGMARAREARLVADRQGSGSIPTANGAPRG